MRSLLVVSFLALGAVPGLANTIWVPDDQPTIQGAIGVAGAGDVVVVRPGIYVENIVFQGKAITVRSEKGPAVTTIDGGQAGSVVTFHSGEGSGSVLEGFTITNGSGTTLGTDTSGGGIFCSGSSPTIRDNVIRENRVLSHGGWDYGGGLYCDASSPRVEGNTFELNFARSAGGAIYCVYSSPDIVGNRFQWNVTDGYGGGVCGVWAAVSITDCELRDNLAGDSGGGISWWGAFSEITGNHLQDNVALITGGGIHCSGPCSVSDNVLRGNWAGSAGGGFHCSYNTGLVSLVGNLVVQNSATYGGGIYSFGETELVGCTVAGNDAAAEGGGIRLQQADADVSDAIVWGNTAPGGDQIWLGSATNPSQLTISYSDLQGGQPAVFADTGCTVSWGAGMVDADPLFLDPPGGDYHLAQDPAQLGVSNPCVDTGDPTTAVPFGTTRSDGVPDAGVVDLGWHDFAHAAAVSDRNAGANPASLDVIGLPQLGTTFTCSVDLVGTTGHSLAWLAGFASPLTFPFSGGQVLLVNPADPLGELLGQPVLLGPIAAFYLAIPQQPPLAGLAVSTQALHYGGVQPYVLSNAKDLVLGY